MIPPPPGNRIGLLGGSFNPAHEGHLHITELALKHLALDRVMWLVSMQNPLKSTEDMASFDERMEHCEHMARHNPNIIISDVEHKLGTTFSADTLGQLTARFPKIGFVWIMGADNMLQIDQWKEWKSIFDILPIAIFSRPDYSESVLSCNAAMHFSGHRMDALKSAELVDATAPAWMFLETPTNPESSTRIRSQD